MRQLIGIDHVNQVLKTSSDDSDISWRDVEEFYTYITKTLNLLPTNETFEYLFKFCSDRNERVGMVVALGFLEESQSNVNFSSSDVFEQIIQSCGRSNPRGTFHVFEKLSTFMKPSLNVFCQLMRGFIEVDDIEEAFYGVQMVTNVLNSHGLEWNDEFYNLHIQYHARKVFLCSCFGE